MAAAVETMAYAGETPWHGLGRKVSDCLTPEEMLVAAGLDWEVRRVALKTADGIAVPSHFALQRSTDKRILGICGRDFQPTQNRQAFKFFKEFVEAGDMKMDTAGSLFDGQICWGLASIQAGFKLAGGDEVNGYLLMSNPHIWGQSIRCQFTSVRVVCNNTLQAAMRSESAGRFTMSHLTEFNDDRQEEAKVAMGIAREQLKLLKEQATFLSKVRVTEESKRLFIARLFQPAILKADNDEEIEMNRTSKLVSDAVDTSPGADLKSAEGTFWGLLNGVTYVVDHKLGRTQDNRLAQAWFGSKSQVKTKALDLALEMANAA